MQDGQIEVYTFRDRERERQRKRERVRWGGKEDERALLSFAAW